MNASLVDEIRAHIRAAVEDHGDIEALTKALAQKLEAGREMFFSPEQRKPRLTKTQRENVTIGLGVFTLICAIGITVFVICVMAQYTSVPTAFRMAGWQLALTELVAVLASVIAIIAMGMLE